MKILYKDFFAGETLEVAKNLLGVEIAFGECRGMIVETEAYKTDDASHFKTRKIKGRALANSYGQVYIYLNYGMYHLLNFTTEKNGIGAVLIRALEPIEGIEVMQKRRKTEKMKNLTNGPGKLCQAFGIGPDQNNKMIGEAISLYERNFRPEIVSSTRIGISKATDLEWRFYIKDNKFISN
ncbi:MAG: DNA-3-methyladenine glycosylase [Candidatus Marinimicrobia bacterium]|nr:DNA-3-methyladenine glycosylase [Candidatus Neomarinimicrobiota bacterium]